MTNYKEEPFKVSLMSICHKCYNIEEKCSMVSKTCGTDSLIRKGYVVDCTRYNMPIFTNKKEKYSVTADNAPDSRIEMMGGGFSE